MRSPRVVSAVMVGLFVALQGAGCTVTKVSGPSDQMFLDIVSGPLREKFSDSELIAEGKKVCAARAQGAKWDELRTMVAKDLNLPPHSDEAGQFMGGVDGGLCSP